MTTVHGENGTPATPEWSPNFGNRCGGCDGTWNLCHVLTLVDEQPCCDACTHGVKTWQGDNA